MRTLRPYQEQAVNECWSALRLNDDPVLLMASVGSGKSLMIATILLAMQKAGKRALCLVNNAELVRNNSETFNAQGGHSSIYCAALDSKDTSAPVVFGTPQSVLNGVNKNDGISRIKFNIIVVDEAHAISYHNHRSCFMRILRHYKQEYPDMRLLGATGTNFRFKGAAIVGPDCLFKTQVGNITTSKLIEDGYLIKPTFKVDPELIIDFSKVKIKSNGQFDAKQLTDVINENTRLTELICKQVIHIMEQENRFGVFLFATTKKHAVEILSHLPIDESAIILGETHQHERTEILEKARNGKIRYLVNIAIISVGVDIPAYDTIAYLRPTESMVLLVQTMGRVLRLSPSTGKTQALIMDFAGNIERHKDWDDPILLDAVKQIDPVDVALDIQCPQCQEWNPQTARRCRGVTNKIRCDYFFEFKECPSCGIQNDIASRNCRSCECELIDPNANLSMSSIKTELKELMVLESKYGISGTNAKFNVNCAYICQDSEGKKHALYERYTPVASEKAKNLFYGQFVKHHCAESSKYYPWLQSRTMVSEMLHKINTPDYLLVDEDNKIKKRVFAQSNNVPHD